MGGYGALMFTLNSCHNIVACAANCPVCDLEAFSSSSDHLPRTIIHSLGAYDGSYDEIMKECSPIYRTVDMPKIPYYIVHGCDDSDVSKNLHSDKFVFKMRELGKNVKYDEVENMGHVAMPPESIERYFDFIFSQV